MGGQPYVYIVESPAPGDLFDGRTEGAALCQALRAINADHTYVMATSLPEFRRAFAIGSEASHFGREFAAHGQKIPIIHLSMHGNDQGIQLSDGTALTWHELRDILMPINLVFPSGVMICFSTCHGSAGVRLSMYEDGKPFYATVGTSEAVPWSDALVGYVAFYHCWGKDLAVGDCVNRMRAASAHEGFMAFSGVEEQQRYMAYAEARRAEEQLTSSPS